MIIIVNQALSCEKKNTCFFQKNFTEKKEYGNCGKIVLEVKNYRLKNFFFNIISLIFAPVPKKLLTPTEQIFLGFFSLFVFFKIPKIVDDCHD